MTLATIEFSIFKCGIVSVFMNCQNFCVAPNEVTLVTLFALLALVLFKTSLLGKCFLTNVTQIRPQAVFLGMVTLDFHDGPEFTTALCTLEQVTFVEN